MGKTVVSSLSPLALSSLFTLTSCQKETTADRKQFHTQTSRPIKQCPYLRGTLYRGRMHLTLYYAQNKKCCHCTIKNGNLRYSLLIKTNTFKMRIH